jgi:phosphoglycolate phosphatase
MSGPPVVLFDIDGTLITTGGAGARAWRRSFKAHFDVDADITVFTQTGQTDPMVARLTFIGAVGREPADGELGALIMGYVMALPDEVAASTGYRVMPGVVDLLHRLAEAGAILGLVTGNIEGAARIKVDRADLNRYFPVGGYGSDSADRGALTAAAIQRAETLHGHELDRRSIFVVGDTPLDVAAAHAAGAVSVAVATGEFSTEELRGAGAEHVLSTLEDPFPGAPEPSSRV